MTSKRVRSVGVGQEFLQPQSVYNPDQSVGLAHRFDIRAKRISTPPVFRLELSNGLAQIGQHDHLLCRQWGCEKNQHQSKC